MPLSSPLYLIITMRSIHANTDDTRLEFTGKYELHSIILEDIIERKHEW